MEDAERFRLLGKYNTPRFRHGYTVLCEVRGEVTIFGLSDAPIPWPIGKRGRNRNSLIVFKDLAKAIRQESNQAVAHWWGVDVQTVSKWRRILRVRRATEGTHRLHSEYATNEPGIVEGRRKSVAKARDPDRREKIAAARRGKPRPPHVGQTVAAAHLGTSHSETTRQKMSATHRQRGTLVPGTITWTPGGRRIGAGAADARGGAKDGANSQCG